MKRRISAIIALMIALALGPSLVASASIPDSAGIIHACVKVNNGSVRIIDTDTSQTCSSSELPLDWNVTGPTGPAGPQGPAGPAGPQGPPGAVGQPQYVTRVTHYDAPPLSAGSFAYFPETVACGIGQRAIGGGVLESQADTSWIPSPPGTENNAAQPGSATIGGGAAEFPSGSPIQTGTISSLPRPVDNYTAWRMGIAISFPITYTPPPARYYAIDVTLFAICI